MKKDILTDTEFWAIIEKMNWNSDCNYNRIDKELIDGVYGDTEAQIRILNTFNDKYSRLEDTALALSDREYTKYVDKSDDGLSDLVSHIIGVGEVAYNKALSEPAGFYDFSDTARESFRYSFHCIYDLMERV